MNRAAIYDFLRQAIPTKWYVGTHVVTTAIAAVACFIPLVNLLGYESAALFGALLGPSAGALTTHMYREGLNGSTSVPFQSPWHLFRQTLWPTVALIVPPFSLLALNALRVKNCDPLAGVYFWVLIPLLSVIIGQSVGILAVCFSTKRWVHNLCIAISVVLPLAFFGWVLATRPPIIGFTIFLGYFGGSIYDEGLQIPIALIWYRSLNLVGVGAIVTAAQWSFLYRQKQPARRLAITSIVLTTIFCVGWLNRGHVGIDRSGEAVAEALGGTIESEHFVIYYSPHSSYAKNIEVLVEDHEYRYDELQRFFQTDPVERMGQKIRSYVYPDRNEKGRLMGARNTLVAKLWLGEIHILWRGIGDHVLAHELAHVFTEEFGNGPLRLSARYGVAINMGLVEGIATAADWPAKRLSPHQASAAMIRLNLAPKLLHLVSAQGFWRQPSRRAYTLMGSFVRYLVDQHGIERFKIFYPRGEFETAYGMSASQALENWREFLETLELSDDELRWAKRVYSRRSIFEKTCARTIGSLRIDATNLEAVGQVEKAQERHEAIIAYAPNEPRHLLHFARFLVDNQLADEAITLLTEDPAQNLIRREELESIALEIMGDASWVERDLVGAKEFYGRCLSSAPSDDTARQVEAKRLSVAEGDPLVRKLLLSYFLEDRRSPVSLFFPMEWMRQQPDSALAGYLVGRRLWAAQEWSWAIPFLSDASTKLKHRGLTGEASLMLGQALHFAGRPVEAKQIFKRLEKHQKSRYRVLGSEWLDRIAWKGRNKVEGAGVL